MSAQVSVRVVRAALTLASGVGSARAVYPTARAGMRRYLVIGFCGCTVVGSESGFWAGVNLEICA